MDNLPAEVSSFIGREAALVDATALLAVHRLVTLTGAPGVGKTRLALRIAAGLRDQFPDGVWLVELAPLGEPSLVTSLVASPFGLRGQDGRSAVETLREYLRSRRLLLVLDNCEHLADTCAALTADLLRACPELRVLTTSREPLGTPGEVCWTVEPLDLPHDAAVPARAMDVWPAAASADANEQAYIDAVLASEAGRLFVERARAVRPKFTLTADAARAVARICQQLEGLPLAIELAAARVAALSPGEIAARLDDQFTLLTRYGRAVLPRQRTLRESVDWSHALLSEAECVLLRRLAIFRGGWSLEAAEAVVSGQTIDGRSPSLPTADCLLPTSILDLLTSLVQKSLVVADDRDGKTRYRSLETIRQYAAERLREAGEDDLLARRHRDWCLALAEEAATHLRGPQQFAWRVRLEVEHDNLRAALGRSIEHDEAEPGLRICIGLWHFWDEGGYDGEGYAWLTRLLALDSASERTVLRAAGLFLAAKMATDGGDLTAALTRCEESLSIARELNDLHTLHRTLTQLGHVERACGQWRAARRYYEEALPIRRELGEPVDVAISLTRLGEVARTLHEFDRAQALFEESLALSRGQDHPAEITSAQYHLGLLAYERGRHDEAAAWFAEALPVARQINHPRRIAYLLEGFAAVAAYQQPERALLLAGAAAALRDARGCHLPPSDQAALKRELAVARRALGEVDTASTWAEGTSLTTDQAITLALSPMPAVAGPATPDAAARLTAREREVTTLVARGLTNRQIAAALVVSPRTAESHVANSLSKLGLTTRSQLAAWAIGNGLVTPADLPPV